LRSAPGVTRTMNSGSANHGIVFSSCRREPPQITFHPASVRSVHEAALEEAERHKWIESQKQGRDLGWSALDEWFSRFWLPYCRQRRLEHIQGSRLWVEFEATEFGRLSELLYLGDLLLDRILDRMEHGYENLDIINWAMDWGLCIDRVLSLLELIDINRARLPPRCYGMG